MTQFSQLILREHPVLIDFTLLLNTTIGNLQFYKASWFWNFKGKSPGGSTILIITVA